MAAETFRDHLRQLYHRLKDNITYTPSEAEVEEAVTDYLTSSSGEGWIDNAITHDAALNGKLKDGSDRTNAEAEALTYQGLHALALHHRAHGLYEKGDVLEARRLSQGARRVTAGIEIHPGAKIGKKCFIDHGASLVIGETAEIGDNVFLYHGVTLGATDGTNARNGKRRHPKIGNDVTIGNGVQVLGSVTVEDGVTISADAKVIGNNITIGAGATIAAGVEVRKSVPAGAHVVGAVPNLPGIISPKQVLTPIYTLNTENQPETKIELKDMEWFKTIQQGLRDLLGAVAGPA